MDRADIVHGNFLARLGAQDLPNGPRPTGTLSPEMARVAFRAACTSRALDLTARQMQREGQGFYTIGSSGHEALASVALAFRTSDMAFLHYRDAAFQLARADQAGHVSPEWDMLLSFAASAEDPISGGRHKVLGSRALMIPPQTSTISSHLPKAVGAAYSVAAAKRHTPEHQVMPNDAVVMASFGDASANHSTAQGAFNAAAWTAYQNIPLPLVFVCEDNGIGISTKTPTGWIKANFAHRPGLSYYEADGLDLYATYQTTKEAVYFARNRKKPVFLHLHTLRLYGHAGADIPTTYLSKTEVETQEANDPLLHFARQLQDSGTQTLAHSLALYQEIGAHVQALSQKAITRPRLATAAQVMASIVPPKRENQLLNGPSQAERAALFGPDFDQMGQPQPMSKLLNWAMTDLMQAHSEIVMMGEDIGKKGGVYGVTQRLQSRFGADRMIDTLLDEQSILGLAIGMAHNGFVAMPEIQFLAYFHNAEDQIRGEAATLSFFSQGQFTNPMVVRIAGLGYQKGFGGHFHNDNSLAALRDIPGVIVACPSNGHDAVLMLREAVRLAREEQRVVLFIEPIALYPMRDLVAPKDGGWMHLYPAPEKTLLLGEVGIIGQGKELAIVTFGNGTYLSCQAAQRLTTQGIANRVIDLRWLMPLPHAALLEALAGCKHILIVDETRQAGGIAEGLMAFLSEKTEVPLARLCAKDSFIATGPAYGATMPSADDVFASALQILGSS
ncbi:MAG TPA: MFS transporter [Rhodobacter sp.]|jgi:2-oxoisovalerate dehydrogenase E1 component|nr:thiamine pyrophosphate-dependent enzyme [Paracoccaceae bacterium]MDO7567505.1 thiamine pyrophosphate-dependent enzyme [Paracoccaceae bacterium]MDO7632318.1 thiamine pyrophosphate-dependent enzyme [Paracoccaceae bacterium]MDO7656402.1 thiamine pyrophosphate-dependent enzyme [Paracoccaceae bacterium]HCM98281.1 MFS transporter [Rhodobacter sp.]